MGERTIIVCRDAEELNQKAAERFIASADRAANSAGRFTVALSGGSTPKGLYALLASAPYNARVPWSQVHLFWGDERCVPPEHIESNYRMAHESLISRVPIPAANVHRMRGEIEPAVAAAEYERMLNEFFSLPKGALPRFGLIFLGLGDDGHTASLFPASAALEERERLVAAPYVEKFQAHRLTLTLPVLNYGADVVFLVAGRSKAAVVKEILETKTDSPILPAARVRPEHGRLAWLVSQDAAAGLPTHSTFRLT
jgi:6-phosphogluconolactonase